MEFKKVKATVGSGTKVHVVKLLDGNPFGTLCGVISYNNCLRGMKSPIHIVDDGCEITCEKCKSIEERSKQG